MYRINKHFSSDLIKFLIDVEYTLSKQITDFINIIIIIIVIYI